VNQYIKQIEIKQSTVLFLFFTIGILFFVGVFPGRLVWDTAGNISTAITGEYTRIYPPFVQVVISLLLFIEKSLAPLFFLQVVAYWLSAYLIALYFFKKKSLILSFMVLIIALYPYNIAIHNVLIKDVWLQSSYLLFVGIICMMSRYNSINSLLFFLLIIVGDIIILTRSNFIALIPPISLAISWILLKKEYNLKYCILLFISTLTLTIFFLSFNNCFHNVITNQKPVDFISRLAAVDLMGMSIRSEHNGVTTGLSKESKKKLNQEYYSIAIFLSNIGQEAIKLRNELRKKDDVKKMWLDAIMENPKLYLSHRFHIFKKLYDGTGKSLITRLNRRLCIGPERLSAQMSTVKLQQIRPTAVWIFYEKYVREYFRIVKSHWWVLFLSFAIFFLSFYKIFIQKIYDNDLIIALLIILFSWSYSFPYIFMLHHPEVRYVFPSNSLILFAVPFFISCFIKNIKVNRQ
jgi:hypothetical protein